MLSVPLDWILILCQPYSVNPSQSFERALRKVFQLRAKGYTVFSPVLHTHFYDLYWKAKDQNFTDDYYRWDLEIYQALNPKCCLFTYDWKTSKGCCLEMAWVIENKVPYYIMLKEEETEE